MSAANAPGPPSAPPLERPKLTYVQLIKEVIETSPTQQLSLKEIYEAVVARYPYYDSITPSWKNVIRHCLSITPAFQNLPRQSHQRGKGGLWIVDYTKPDVYSRKRVKRADHSRTPSVSSPQLTASKPLASGVVSSSGSDGSSTGSAIWRPRKEDGNPHKYPEPQWSTSPPVPLNTSGRFPSSVDYMSSYTSGPGAFQPLALHPSDLQTGSSPTDRSQRFTDGLGSDGRYPQSAYAPASKTYESAQPSSHALAPSPSIAPPLRQTRALSTGHWPGTAMAPPPISNGWGRSSPPPPLPAGPLQTSQSTSPRLLRALAFKEPLPPPPSSTTSSGRSSLSSGHVRPTPYDHPGSRTLGGSQPLHGIRPSSGYLVGGPLQDSPIATPSPASTGAAGGPDQYYYDFAQSTLLPPPSSSSTTSLSALGLTLTGPPSHPRSASPWPPISGLLPSQRSSVSPAASSPFFRDYDGPIDERPAARFDSLQTGGYDQYSSAAGSTYNAFAGSSSNSSSWYS